MLDINLNVNIGFTKEAHALLSAFIHAGATLDTTKVSADAGSLAKVAEKIGKPAKKAKAAEEPETEPAKVEAAAPTKKISLEEVRTLASWFQERSDNKTVVPELKSRFAAIGVTETIAKADPAHYAEMIEVMENYKSELENG